jgi:hypothetical protein
MAKQLGDRLLTSITRGGFQDVKVTIDRGAGAAVESLWPSVMGSFRETPQFDQGLDGKVDIKWWLQELEIGLVQCDEETLEDLYAAALEAQWYTTGVSVALTFINGMARTLTMRMVPEVRNDGYGAVLQVGMRFRAASLTPMFR